MPDRFGIDEASVLKGLKPLSRLKEQFAAKEAAGKQEASEEESDFKPVTIMQCTPSRLKMLMEDAYSKQFLQSIKTMLIGGEAFPVHLLEEWGQQTSARFINMYGPTETTIWSTTHEMIVGEERSRIGRPIANTQIYILNKERQLLPLGVTGEIYIGGAGVARGYLNRPELTDERFIPSPFPASERLYRTGDLGRWLPDGTLEHLGRSDDQVKIRGYRIELGEIEAQLRQMEGVKEAIVVARENEHGHSELHAYMVAEAELTITQLRSSLTEALPAYMIPSQFMQLKKLPLTPNGKIDRKALPAPDGKLSTGMAYVAPRNETEQVLAEIWQELLGVAQVGVHDNFFDLGGHSLKAMMLISRIHRQFEVEVGLRDVFRHPVLKELAAVIAVQGKSEYATISQVEERPYYPVSSAQKRMYVLSEMEGAGTSYNTPFVLRLEGKLDRERLKAAMNQLIARHEALRTSFELSGEDVVQIIHPSVAFTLGEKRCTEAEAKARVEAFIRPFDLTQAPLLRVEVLQLAEENHLLLLDMHHIISDGVSMGVFVEEFARLYTGEALPEMRIQYKDYAVWEQERQDSEAMKAHEAYWLERFGGELPVMQLPLDNPRSALQQSEGDRMAFTLDRELTTGLRRLAEETETTLYMVLLTAYKTLLFRYTGQEDLIVGTPVAGGPTPIWSESWGCS